MWKKEEALYPGAATRSEPASPPRREPTSEPERSASPRAPRDRATIGRSITIKGEVTGDEDLLIEGRVDGSVNLKQHSITVGPEGEVKANIIGRVVTVEGSVEGNLSAEEQVILRSSALVQGDIAAPRVVLEDGARFSGGVDMGELDRSGRSSSSSRSATTTKSESGRTGAAAQETTRAEASASGEEKSSSSGAGDGATRTAQISL